MPIDTKTFPLGPAIQAGLVLLEAGFLFHIRHLKAKSHAEHVVLDSVYKDAITLGDELLEQVLGMDKSLLDVLHGGTPERVMVDGPVDAALASLVKELEAATLQTVDVVVQNKLQEIVANFRQRQYLLDLALKEASP